MSRRFVTVGLLTLIVASCTQTPPQPGAATVQTADVLPKSDDTPVDVLAGTDDVPVDNSSAPAPPNDPAPTASALVGDTLWFSDSRGLWKRPAGLTALVAVAQWDFGVPRDPAIVQHAGQSLHPYTVGVVVESDGGCRFVLASPQAVLATLPLVGTACLPSAASRAGHLVADGDTVRVVDAGGTEIGRALLPAVASSRPARFRLFENIADNGGSQWREIWMVGMGAQIAFLALSNAPKITVLGTVDTGLTEVTSIIQADDDRIALSGRSSQQATEGLGDVIEVLSATAVEPLEAPTVSLLHEIVLPYPALGGLVAAPPCPQSVVSNGGSQWWCAEGAVVAAGVEWLAAWGLNSGAPIFSQSKPGKRVTALALGTRGWVYNGGSQWLPSEAVWLERTRPNGADVDVDALYLAGDMAGGLGAPNVACSGAVVAHTGATGDEALITVATDEAGVAAHAWPRPAGANDNAGIAGGAGCGEVLGGGIGVQPTDFECATGPIVPLVGPNVSQSGELGATTDSAFSFTPSACDAPIFTGTWGASTPEQVHVYLPQESGPYRITLKPAPNTQMSVAVMDACNESATCGGFAVAEASSPATLNVILEADKAYYLVVDGALDSPPDAAHLSGDQGLQVTTEALDESHDIWTVLGFMEQAAQAGTDATLAAPERTLISAYYELAKAPLDWLASPLLDGSAYPDGNVQVWLGTQTLAGGTETVPLPDVSTTGLGLDATSLDSPALSTAAAGLVANARIQVSSAGAALAASKVRISYGIAALHGTYDLAVTGPCGDDACSELPVCVPKCGEYSCAEDDGCGGTCQHCPPAYACQVDGCALLDTCAPVADVACGTQLIERSFAAVGVLPSATPDYSNLEFYPEMVFRFVASSSDTVTVAASLGWEPAPLEVVVVPGDGWKTTSLTSGFCAFAPPLASGLGSATFAPTAGDVYSLLVRQSDATLSYLATLGADFEATDPLKFALDVACCAPDCSGKACGTDGCGGWCGVCAAGEACQAGDCSVMGATCETTKTLSCGQAVPLDFNDFTRMDSAYAGTCGVFDTAILGGPEEVYSWEAPSDGQVSLSLSPPGMASMIHVLSGSACDPTLPCVGAGTPEVKFTASAGQRYFVVVDALPAGTYSPKFTPELHLDCGTP